MSDDNPRRFLEAANDLCANERAALEAAVCLRCHGRGITGHMGIGHDECRECRGLGVRAGHDVNLYLVAMVLRDRIVDQLRALDTALRERDAAEARGWNAALAAARECLAEEKRRYRAVDPPGGPYHGNTTANAIGMCRATLSTLTKPEGAQE